MPCMQSWALACSASTKAFLTAGFLALLIDLQVRREVCTGQQRVPAHLLCSSGAAILQFGRSSHRHASTQRRPPVDGVVLGGVLLLVLVEPVDHLDVGEVHRDVKGVGRVA